MQNSMVVSLSLFETENSHPFWKFGPKNRNCQFKLKIGTQTNSNMRNLIVMFIFLCFRPEVYFFFEICSKNQNCLSKLKFKIQVNLNMQNSMVIFIFLVRKYPSFCVNLIQKVKSQFKTKFGTQTILDMQNFMVIITFSILGLFCKFCPKINFTLMLPD